MNKNETRKTAVLLALGVLLVHGLYMGGFGWNQNARLGSIFSFVEGGQPETHTVRIDPYVRVRPRHGLFSQDWAFFGGHYYSNKAPGLTILGIPVYAAIHSVILWFGGYSESESSTAWSAYLLNLVLGVLPTACATAWFFLFLVTRGSSPPDAMARALVFSFATLLFPFDTSFWGHATTASCLLFALTFFEEKPILCGVFAGAALFTEYQAGLAALIFGGAYLLTRKKAVPGYLAGALVFATPLLVYQAVVFGNPFTTAFSLSNPAFLGGPETGGTFGNFSFLVMAKLLFSPARGLFIYCPVLLAIFFRRNLSLSLLQWLCVAQVGTFLIFLAGFNGWHGGWSSGPRYLIPVLPFLCMALPDLSSLSRWCKWISIGLGFISMMEMWMVSLVGTMAPSDLPNPFSDFFFPRITGMIPVDPSHFPLVASFTAQRLVSLAVLIAVVYGLALRSGWMRASVSE
ncbi:MAG: hypothetical protein ACXWP1_04715, partial [Bdellovibrionota bacterium]